MAILKTEIKRYKAAVNNDGDTNGGIMSAVESVSGVAGNVLPPVSQAERAAGVTRYRKAFGKVANDDDLTLNNARAYVENFTPGDDRVLIFLGNQTNTQVDLTGTERRYGCGQLDASVLAGVTSIDVLMEDGDDDAIQDGDTIRISDMTDIDDGLNNEEEHVVSGAPVKNGDVYTITLATQLANDFDASDTRVASLMPLGNIAGAYSGFTVTSDAGAYDDTGNPVELDNIGTIQDSFTLTFTSATDFDIAGLVAGALGSGNISSDTAPANPGFGKPYWTLRSAGFSGTFEAGDTIEFNTSPAAAPIWYEHIVPAGAASLTANQVIVVVDGESA